MAQNQSKKDPRETQESGAPAAAGQKGKKTQGRQAASQPQKKVEPAGAGKAKKAPAKSTAKSTAKSAPKNTAKSAAKAAPGQSAARTRAESRARRGMRLPLPAAAGQAVTTYSRAAAQALSKKPGKDKNTGAPRLRVIPLGGLNEIGKNMTALEYGEDIVVIDCGMTFPDDELLGVDLVIPDITYLIQNRQKVRGIVLTHAHEDHIGALPYVLRELKVPVYCTALTAGIISLRLSEHKNLGKVKINRKKAGDRFRLGCFDIEMVRVNHSVPDAVALAIKTPVGVVVFTGDFKIDTTPINQEMTDLERFGKLGRDGVLLLCQDSTNAERPGFTSSERSVGASFDMQFKHSEGQRIIIATFASNVHRIQQIIDIAARYGRKVAVSGRSMENIIKVGVELGYLQLPPNTLIELNALPRYRKEETVIITTGSQGEPMSALYRMAFSGHRQVEVGEGDKILIAAQPIPGNEKAVYGMINELFKRGAEVVYEKLADIHVSGHACQQELKIILALTRPRFFMPVHGEYRHLQIHAGLAMQGGMKEENIFISDVGRVLELDGETAAFAGTVPSGRVLVDGYGVGDVGAAVLRERKHLSQDGLIVIATALERRKTTIVQGPEVFSRGFIFVKEAEDLTDGVRRLAQAAIEGCAARGVSDRSVIKNEIADRVEDYLYKKTKRGPMVLPVIMEV